MDSKRMALCGLLTALAEVCLLLGSVIPAATFCAPLLAMIVLLPVLEEYGGKAAALSYAAAALLALLLVPERETALVYVCFGWYPILRPRLHRIPVRTGRAAVKVALSTALILLLYGVLLRLLGLTADLEGASRALSAALVVMGDVLFLLLDLVLGRMTALWRGKLRRRFFRGGR